MPFSSKLPEVFIPDDITVTDFATQNLLKHPDIKLLIDPYGENSFTCQQAFDTINKISAGFQQKGLKLGDVVAVCLPTLTVYPLIVLGIQNLGAIPTTLNPTQVVEELVRQMKETSAQYLVTTPQLVGKLHVERTEVKEIIVLGEASGATPFKELINNDGLFTKTKFNPRTTVGLIPYSSGTTGLPKGVEITHYNMVANTLQATLGVVGDHETLITFLPFFHAMGMMGSLRLFLKCYTLVVMPKLDIPDLLKFVQDYKVTVLPLVPPVFLALAKEPSLSQYDFSSLKAVASGAAPLNSVTQEALKSRLPNNVIVSQGYGMTELTCSSHGYATAPGSVGQLLPYMSIKIVDPETGKEVGLQQSGEVWLKGPNVMKGYFKNPKATAEIIDQDGYLHTGDIGYMDDNHNLFIVDRIKELIKYKAFQVAPAELEELLLRHPDIDDAAVIGKPDLEAGELPIAFVVRKPGSQITAKQIVEWAEPKTAPYKKLRGGVIFVNKIPKSDAGKILRKMLRANL